MSKTTVVKNCSTCGHMTLKGIFIITEYCNMSRQYCNKAREYPASANCYEDYTGWVSSNTITISFENYEKFKMWEKLNERT